MNGLKQRIVLCIALAGLLGCEAKVQPQAMASVSALSSYENALPPDALNVTKSPVGKTEQAAFLVRRRYPEFAFTDDVLAKLGKEGWTRCPNVADEWSSFLDATSGSMVRVHQKVVYLKKASSLLILAGRYSSSVPAGSSVHEMVPPNSDDQAGNVISLTGSPAELEEALKAFDARC